MRRLIPAVLTSLALATALTTAGTAMASTVTTTTVTTTTVTGSATANATANTTANTTAATTAAVTVPPAPRPMAGIEAGAVYVPQVSCDMALKPGTASLAALLTTTYPGTTAGTVRMCASDGSISEHYDGRAVDWMTTVRTPDGLARGNALTSWLIAADAQGNGFANARRLGIMYIIWNNQIWGAYSPSDGWRPYSTCAAHPESSMDTACHRDHVHLSLSWEGAMRRTSYWTGTVATPDYGPCRVPDLTFAPPYTAARSTSCPTVPLPVVPSGASTMTRQLIPLSGMLLRPGTSGSPVAVVNARFGVAGSSWTASTTTAVQALQSGAGIPVSGVLDVATWRALLGVVTPPPTSPLGVVDAESAAYRSLSVRGWAFDPESTGPIQVRVTVDGVVMTVTANQSRPDVGAAFPGAGSAHGFGLTVAAVPGTHAVCVTAVNVGAGSDTSLGCQDVVVAASPMGHLDAITATAYGVTLSGWVTDPDTMAAASVRILVDGTVRGSASATGSRPDVALAYPGAPVGTGYAAAVDTGPGTHLVCVVGVNVGAGSDVTLGCAQVRVTGRQVSAVATLGSSRAR